MGLVNLSASVSLGTLVKNGDPGAPPGPDVRTAGAGAEEFANSRLLYCKLRFENNCAKEA